MNSSTQAKQQASRYSSVLPTFLPQRRLQAKPAEAEAANRPARKPNTKPKKATTSRIVKTGVMMVSFLYSPICFKSVFTKNIASYASQNGLNFISQHPGVSIYVSVHDLIVHLHWPSLLYIVKDRPQGAFDPIQTVFGYFPHKTVV